MNTIVLTGNLARDPELRYTPDNKAVAQFTVAVKRPFTKDKVDFINCVAWEKEGENIDKYFSKGSFIALRGYLTIRTYEANDGQKKTFAEVIVNEFGFGGGKKEETKEEKKSTYDKPIEVPAEKQPDFFSEEFVPF